MKQSAIEDIKPPFLARVYFAWGQSCAYWGNTMLAKWLHRWAVGSWTKALRMAPDWAAPRLRRAVILGRELDNYTGAVDDLTLLIEQQPEWAEPYLQRGLLHSFHGLAAAPRAIADFERFLTLSNPDHTWRPDAERLIQRHRVELQERGWNEVWE